MKLPKRSGRWFAILLFLAMLLLTSFGKEGWIALFIAKNRNIEMNRKLSNMKRHADSLRTIIDKLENDTLYIEKIAREKLGMIKKGERVYKFNGDRKK